MKNIISQCRVSGLPFEVTGAEQDFLLRVGVPIPTLHPRERMRRLMAFSNYINLYQRKCSATGSQIISGHRPGTIVPVYNMDYWTSDKWDGLSYGRPYDFNKPFFTQLAELKNAVPLPARTITHSTLNNSDYINGAARCSNCYLIFNAIENEDCLFGMTLWNCRDCIDCNSAHGSELCYDCTFIENSYELRHSFNCKHCQDSAFLWNCNSCQDCFCCVNLQHGRYSIFNQQLTEAEYRNRITRIEWDNFEFIEETKRKFESFVQAQPQPAIRGVEFGGSVGDCLYNCRNAINCFDCSDLEDCLNCVRVQHARDCMDFYSIGKQAELIYCSARCGLNVHNLKFCYHVTNGSSDVEYSSDLFSCRNCFGCVGLKQKNYCILNKQYTKDQYEDLRKRIIRQMSKDGESNSNLAYGEFFPYALSGFPYSDSDAMMYYPLSEREALALEARWENWEDPLNKQTAEHSDMLPARARDADKSISEKVFQCPTSGQAFRITKAEMEVYRRRSIPVPREHWKVRLLRRHQMRNGIELYPRLCAKTGEEIMTSYPPDSPWIVWNAQDYYRTFSG